MLAWRAVRDRWRIDRVRAGGHARNVLIVGAGPRGREVAAHLELRPEFGRSLRGFIDDRKGFGVLGPVEELAAIARAEFADEVIVATPDADLIQRVVREATRNHLDVRVVPDLFGYQLADPWIESWGDISVLTLHEESWPALRLGLKRILDVFGSAVGMAVLAPVLGAIALLVKLDSPGPAFYTAPRVGRKGRRFHCLKFRTMRVNADAIKDELRSQNQREGPCFKIVGDPRITRVGRVLRRYSLDELLQLWNVLKGEMSLVGPRPHPVDDFARYELGHFRRLDVTPGITGLWQITARRSPSFQTNMALDLEYIEQWSLWMDLRILCKTVAVVLQGTGA
jgi:exopolysaccharide biosynthesis polyprenyl glycosylphosphotransferase